ncbi:hypothetical protein ACH4MG_34935 [Streptomyces sp. NPDC017454]|uniref:hypothetical protein n=1 Tax=Streptomyces sp. NPDC017454 TaxID=3364997 RepID=UPI0037AF1B8C
MQFRKLPKWVHYALSIEMHKPHFRRHMERCVTREGALIIQLAYNRGLVWQLPVASVQEAYSRLGINRPPEHGMCYLVAVSLPVLAAAQTAGVPYMRLPMRTSAKVRREGRALEFLRVPMDAFRPAVEVHGV